MSVDVFGRIRGKVEVTRGPSGNGYKLTEDGNYDIENKRICNLGPPVESTDAVNFITLQQQIKEQELKLNLFKKEVSDWLTIFKAEVERILGEKI